MITPIDVEEKDKPELCVCMVNIDKIWREERISSTTAINMKEQFLLLSIKQNKSADCVRRSLCVCVALSVGLSLSQFRQFVRLAFVCHIYSIKAKSSSKWRLEKRERVNLNLVFFFSFSRRTRRVFVA